VTLKVLRAEATSKLVDEVPELAVSRKLLEYIQVLGPVAHSKIQTVQGAFYGEWT